jgi:hypothetical protein
MIIPVGTAQVTHIFSGNAVPNGAAVVYGVDNTGALTAGQVASTSHDIFKTTLLTALTASITLERTLAKLGPNATGAVGEWSDPSTPVSADDTATPQVSYLLTKRTSVGGRKGRGRMYVPCVAEDLVASTGVLTAPAMTALQGEADQFLADLDTAGIQMILLHNDSTVPYVVVSLEVSQRVATQRRRLRG